jgi:uncharacterized protein YegJ (DUF2314 family)
MGILNNKPVDVKTVKLGEKVEVTPDKISDWKYIENGRLVGGFTTRVIRDGMMPKEREQLDHDLPFKIE